MMAASDVGVIKESDIYQPLLADEPLLVWSGVSSQYKTALHFMSGTILPEPELPKTFNCYECFCKSLYMK